MKAYRSIFASSVALVLVSQFALAQTEDWPQFRGPNGTGKSAQTGLPLEWDDEKNIVWKSELPGMGASSPVTFKDKIFLTCYSGYGIDPKDKGDMKDLKRHLVCISPEDGKVVWDVTQASTNDQEPYQNFTPLHGYASGSPAVDESGIYVFYGTTGAAAYDHDGKQRWLVNCGTKHHVFGTSNSPTIAGDLVIINASVECGDLIAFDKKTGAEKWRKGGMAESWNTPTLVKNADGASELVVHVKGKVLAFNPENGEELWNCEGIGDYICPSIIAEGDMIYAIGGRQNSCLAVRSGGKGDVTESHVVWRIRKGSNVTSPVFHDGHLYWTMEKGTAYCAKAEDGSIVYEKRIPKHKGLIYSSPIAADGRLYYISRENGTYVLPLKPEFEILAHNKIESDESIVNASPVVSNGNLILRSDKFLYCIGNK